MDTDRYGTAPSHEQLEIDLPAIIEVLVRHGLDEGQPEQVAGRWVEAGIEHPAEIERMIEQGIVDPERAAAERSAHRAAAHERHAEASDPRDVVRGTTRSRTRPGDEGAPNG